MVSKVALLQPLKNSADWDVPLNSNFGVVSDGFGTTTAVSITSANVTLSATQAQAMGIAVSGAMSGNRSLFLPVTTSGTWVITNSTTGGFTLTVYVNNGAGSPAGAGVSPPVGTPVIIYSDGTNVKFANNYIPPLSVGTAQLIDGSVTTAKILDGNVTTTKILDGNVTTTKIADNNVTTAKILDANVTSAKIADGSITATKLNGAQTGSPPVFGARAFASWTVSGTTLTIRASGNVSSVVRNAAGDYTVNFSTAMPDAYYIAIPKVVSSSAAYWFLDVTSQSTTSFRVVTYYGQNPVPTDGFTSAGVMVIR